MTRANERSERIAKQSWPEADRQGSTHASSGFCQDGKTPAFCAEQGQRERKKAIR